MRFRVKIGRDQEFFDAHKDIASSWPGLRHVNIIKTDDRGYCIIAVSFNHLVSAGEYD